MFTPKGLFKTIPCPNLEECRLPNCLFSHDAQEKDSVRRRSTVTTRPKIDISDDGSSTPIEPDRKRRKLSPTQAVPVPVRPIDMQLRSGMKTARPGVETIERPKTTSPVPKETASSPSLPKDARTSTSKHPSREITPPPLKRPARRISALAPPKPEAKPVAKPIVWESLNPRLVPKDPVGHGKRFSYLQLLHREMVRLNDEAANVPEATSKRLLMHRGQLIKLALDEEEKLVLEGGAVYPNLFKQRLFKYKKMPVAEWLEVVEAWKRPKKPVDPTKGKPVETGLEPQQEVALVARFKADQDNLEQYGYVTRPLTASEIESAKAGQDEAKGWEECDRCKSRFQVFPDRREDGALTSGGTCVYHWGKRIFPKREKIDAEAGAKPTLFECCNEPLGSDGCTTHPTHVFKVSEPKRLAVVLPFEQTPGNPSVAPETALAFDCEMGYTTKGMELIRLSAAAWPSGRPVLDILVKPFGAILDFNTRFSGVSHEQFTSAAPLSLDPTTNLPLPNIDMTGASGNLHIVPSPAAARAVFCTLISPRTPLIGHALENDLNALRLVHPTLVDTVLLFPHPRGLPIRRGLRNLAREWLGRSIQQGGADGHDSLEDARAAGDLVRLRVGKEWRRLRAEGWRVDGERFVPPEGKDGIPPLPAELPPYDGGSLGSLHRKRKDGE